MPTKLGALVAAEVFTHTIGNAGLGAWSTWSPSYTNLTIGNGTVVAKYAYAGRTTFFKWRLDRGSTSSITGTPIITLPVAMADGHEAHLFPVLVYDSGTYYAGMCLPNGTTGIQLAVLNSSGTYAVYATVSGTVPTTTATGDALIVSGTYEGAS